MFRKLVGPAIVLGLSLLATSAHADNSDDSHPDEQAQPEVEKKPPYVPGLQMQITGDSDASTEEFEPEAEFVVSEGLLDKTVALPEDVEGLPDLGYYYRMEEGDLKTGGSLDGTAGYAMNYRLEGGSVFVRSEHFVFQTPVSEAQAMDFVSDLTEMGLSAALTTRP
jgi:hypothetical protein